MPAGDGRPRQRVPPARSLSRTERRLVAYEREAEHFAIGKALDAAQAGHGQLVVVEGAVGSGRSLLLELAAHGAGARGFDVLVARGTPAESDFDHGVARQLLEPRVQQSTSVERQRLFAASAAVTAPLFGVRSTEPVTAERPDPHRMAHGLAWLLHNISRVRPTCIVVDDADAADDASMRALIRLVQRIGDLSIVMILAMREAGLHASTGPAEELRAHHSAKVARLAPLSVTGTTRLTRKRFFPDASEEFCRELTRWCGGNPAQIAQVLQALERDGTTPGEVPVDLDRVVPADVVRAAAGRLTELAADAQALARALACLGDGATLGQGAVLARLEGARPSVALDVLVRAGILVAEGGGALRFATPLLGAATEASILPGERSRAHLQAARLLRGQGADDDEVAAHLLSAQASGDRWSAAVLERAAAGALARGEADLAVRYLERAVAEPPPPERRGPIMAMLGQAEVVAGMPTAAERFRAAAGLLTDPEERAGVYDDLGRRLLLKGATADAAVAFGQGLDTVVDPASEVGIRLLAGLIRTVLLDPSLRPRWKDRLRLPPTAEGVDGHTNDPAGRALLALVFLDRLGEGAPSTLVRDLCRKLIAAIDASPDPGREAATRCDAGLVLLRCGDLDGADRVLSDALGDARSPGLRLSTATRRVLTRLVQGRLADAEADARTAVEEATTVAASAGPSAATVTASGLLALVLLERGDTDGAARAIAAAGAGEVDGRVAAWELAAGHLALARHEAARAFGHLTGAARAAHAVPPLQWQPGAALAAAMAGRTDEALQHATLHLRAATDQPLVWVMAEAKATLGQVSGGPAGLRLLREAVDHLAGSGARLEEAKARVALGTALVAAGEREDGAASLREGAALAAACGAGRLAADARSALASTGGSAPSGGLAQPPAPTPGQSANDLPVIRS